MRIEELMLQIGTCARTAQADIACATNNTKNKALEIAASALKERQAEILAENIKDQESAKESGVSPALIDRLSLNAQRIQAMISSINEITAFPDPVGIKLDSWTRPNGLQISKITCPIGVIGMIYEARPNVTADASMIAIKSGNCIILRGGSDCYNSSKIIAEIFRASLQAAGLNPDIVQFIPSKERAAVEIMLGMVDYIDIIIPRGGESLTKLVAQNSKVPTLLHLTGNCHTYIHQSADFDMARKVLINAKMRRTSICGATESMVIDEAIAPKLLPLIADDLNKAGCKMLGDSQARAIDSRIGAATDEDWSREYLDSIISIKVVANLDEAISHINKYSSHHTEAIISQDQVSTNKFMQMIDSASVMHNCSTQFADGYEYGLGAEIGIATGKLHARGPVSINQLTTFKYLVEGTGQVRE